MKTLAVLFLILMLAPAALAQTNEALLSWDASVGARGYRIYCGTQAGNYNAPGYPLDVGLVTERMVAFQAEGVEFFCVVSAYNGAGESGYSTEVSSFPRPEAVDMPSSCAPGPGSDVACTGTLAGFNFAPDLGVAFGTVGVTTTRVTRNSSREAVVEYTIPGTTQPGPSDLILTQGTLDPVVLQDFVVISPVVLPTPPANPVWR